MDGRRLHGAEKEKWRSVWPLKFSRKEVKRPKSGFRKNYLEGTFRAVLGQDTPNASAGLFFSSAGRKKEGLLCQRVVVEGKACL